MQTLLQVLMERDNLTRDEARAQIAEARAIFHDEMMEPDFDAEQFLADEFGLEPDYLEDLLYGPEA